MTNGVVNSYACGIQKSALFRSREQTKISFETNYLASIQVLLKA